MIFFLNYILLLSCFIFIMSLNVAGNLINGHMGDKEVQKNQTKTKQQQQQQNCQLHKQDLNQWQSANSVSKKIYDYDTQQTCTFKNNYEKKQKQSSSSVVMFATAGQLISAVQLGGGNGLRLGGEVPWAGGPVQQRGSVPDVRGGFSAGGSLVPHGLSLTMWTLWEDSVATQAPLSGSWQSVEVFLGANVSLMQEEQARVIRRPSVALPARVCGIAGSSFVRGDLTPLRKLQAR